MTASTIPTLADLRAELADYCGHPAKRGNKAKAKRVNETVQDYLRAGFSEYDAVRRTIQGLGLVA
jgi:hypothetical protein